MKTSARVLILAFITALWPAVAMASALSAFDSASYFASADLHTLEDEAHGWPFDVHLLATNADSFETLENMAHEAVNAPNVMVIAIDPAHHKIVTRFGTSTGVKPGDYDSISKAGNAHLRAGEVRAGIEAIVLRAKASREAHVAISASSEPVVLREGLSAGTWLLIVMLVVGFAGLAIWLWRRNKKERGEFKQALDENREETAELRSRNIEESTWRDTVETGRAPVETGRAPSAPRSPYHAMPRARRSATVPAVAPVTQPVVVNNIAPTQQSDRFAEGLILGKVLSDRPEPVVVREREVIRERPRPDKIDSESSFPSNDSGGASSSFDSGGSSSYDPSPTSSYDSGGSSSSYDSGGSSGFDGGGGGSDGGGGDSSF